MILMIKWWRNLSVVKKLYAVVGIMAVLIASELFTLLFAMNTLSAVRAFVAGEGLWTKAQKDAIHSLYQYALSGDETDYLEYQSHFRIPEGDHIARLELQKANFDYEIVRDGFRAGGNHPNDIDGMIQLLVRFHNISFIQEAVAAWTRADGLLAEFQTEASEIHRAIKAEGRHSPGIPAGLRRIAAINVELTKQENAFSSALGAGSRWLESLLMTILAIVVLTIESTGIFLTFRFSRTLSTSLRELRDTAGEVGKGNFLVQAAVRSKDELGQLAIALNKMIFDLRSRTLERDSAKESSRHSEEKFRRLVEAAKDYAIYLMDEDGIVTSWNSGAAAVFGYSSQEIIGKHYSIFFSKDDIQLDNHVREIEIAKSLGRFESDGVRKRKDGTEFWANFVIATLYDANGLITGFSKIVRDITERKQIELRLQRLNEDLERRVEERTNEIKERETQLRQITNAVPVLIAQLDVEQKFLFANDAFCQWFQLTHREVIGHTFREVLGEERYPENEPHIRKVLGGEVTNYERRSVVGSASVVFDITYLPDVDEKGKVIGFFLVANDITNYKKIEEELKKAKEVADTANATKSAFLANMSHEIRTPLGVVLGFSELISNQALSSSERLNYIEIIKRNGQLLSNIINDILDLSKVEAGKMEVERVDVSFAEMISEINSLLRLQATEKGIEFKVTAEQSIPSVIKTDPLRLRQILLNIVGNAIKFTDHGSVEIDIRMENEGLNSKLLFVVKDTGKGIQPEHVLRLFTPFTQADASTTRLFGGTGLGLVLSKKLAIALGGDVYLKETSIGYGSTFVVSIDPGIAESFPVVRTLEKIDVNRSNDLKNYNILLVDDSLDNQIIVKRFLNIAGATVDTANNGKEAVSKAMAGDFNLILMDLQMPIMDGYQAIRALRDRGYTKPVIALTAHAMKEERKRCIESGFDEHLNKPVNRDLLINTVAKYISDRDA